MAAQGQHELAAGAPVADFIAGERITLEHAITSSALSLLVEPVRGGGLLLAEPSRPYDRLCRATQSQRHSLHWKRGPFNARALWEVVPASISPPPRRDEPATCNGISVLVRGLCFRPPTHFSHMSHPTFPISHRVFFFFPSELWGGSLGESLRDGLNRGSRRGDG